MKNKRQNEILSIIVQKVVNTQEDLQNELLALGYNVTQSTVSRDIKELNLVKTPVSGGKTKYTLYQSNETQKNKLESTIYDRVVSIERVEFVVILNTLRGNANVVSALIDEMSFPQILGTLAGHDTVVIFAKDLANAVEIRDYLRSHLSPHNI